MLDKVCIHCGAADKLQSIGCFRYLKLCAIVLMCDVCFDACKESSKIEDLNIQIKLKDLKRIGDTSDISISEFSEIEALEESDRGYEEAIETFFGKKRG